MSFVYDHVPRLQLQGKLNWVTDPMAAVLCFENYDASPVHMALSDIPEDARAGTAPIGRRSIDEANNVAVGVPVGFGAVAEDERRILGVVIYRVGRGDPLLAYMDDADQLPFRPNNGSVSFELPGFFVRIAQRVK